MFDGSKEDIEKLIMAFSKRESALEYELADAAVLIRQAREHIAYSEGCECNRCLLAKNMDRWLAARPDNAPTVATHVAIPGWRY